MTEVPMRPGSPLQSPARWCGEHERWECSKTPKRNPPTCHGPAVDGTGACRMHLGTTVAAAQAGVEAQRTLLRAASELGPVHPAETLLEANRIATIVMRRAAELVEAGSMLPAQLDVLGQWMDRAQRIAKATADADAADRWVRAQESVASRDADRVEALVALFVAKLGLSWQDPDVRRALVEALDELEAGGGS